MARPFKKVSESRSATEMNSGGKFQMNRRTFVCATAAYLVDATEINAKVGTGVNDNGPELDPTPTGGAGRTNLPDNWLEPVDMSHGRVLLHWTGGGPMASASDRQHYHFVIQQDGSVIRGDHPISSNFEPLRPGSYAAHVLNLNSGSIGIAMAGMMHARERDFDPGPQPINWTQWSTATAVIAQISREYQMPVTPLTVLTHAEVEGTYGIRQRAKWDVTRLPFDHSVQGAAQVGKMLRNGVLKQR